MILHVRDSVQQIDPHSWLIGERLILHRRHSIESSDHLWKDERGWHYSITEAPTPLPSASPIPSDRFPKLVHDAGDQAACFDFGGAFLKVRDHQIWFPNVTHETVTLRWLADRKDKLSFSVPKALHCLETDTRMYLFLSRVPGKTLDKAWRTLSSEQKTHCVERVTQICQELAAWTSNSIVGVDGKWCFDTWLNVGKDCDRSDLSPETLLRNCQQLKMDTSTLVLNHNDLGPTNIMVDVDKDCEIGVVDWELAGYVPFTWVRTKFAVSWAMNHCWLDVSPVDPSMNEWRLRMAEELGKCGIPSVAKEWISWYGY